MAPYYDSATPLIPVAHQPALVAEQLEALDLDVAEALRAAGLDARLLADAEKRLAPTDYLHLLRGAALVMGGREAAFVLGQPMLPGHFGAASHALLRAPTLRRALQVLAAHPARLSPLLAPHFVVEEQLAALYWTDACASAGLRPFLVELQMSAVAAMCDWLAGTRLPWQYCFARTAPRQTETHEAHLGTRLRFGCQIDAMLIAPEWLDRPWTNPRGSVAPVLQQALDAQACAEDARHSFLARLYGHLLAHCAAGRTHAAGVEPTAAAFGISPATLKRRLAAHGTHFQAEIDQVRAHVALQLMHCRGCDNETVARHLGFNDAANFRRSLKRWTGLTPLRLRASLV
jgi:AraC-like DNA-binding protein